MMEAAPGMNIPTKDEEITVAIIQETYDAATRHLKERVGFIFEDKKARYNDWSVSTWEKR